MHLNCGTMVLYSLKRQNSQPELEKSQNFSARLREERVRLSPSQLKFAEKAGIDNTVLSALENGRQLVRAEHLALCADAGVDVSYVVTGRRGGELLGKRESRLLDVFRSLDPIGQGTLLLIAVKMAPDAHLDPRSVIQEMLNAFPTGSAAAEATIPNTNAGSVHSSGMDFRGEEK